MSARSDAVPALLARRMLEALSRQDIIAVTDPATAQHALDSAAPDALARAGLSALRSALAQDDDRSAAFDLLAADALLTQACADAATHGIPDVLAPERFVALLEER
jgi:hypothetical protein